MEPASTPAPVRVWADGNVSMPYKGKKPLETRTHLGLVLLLAAAVLSLRLIAEWATTKCGFGGGERGKDDSLVVSVAVGRTGAGRIDSVQRRSGCFDMMHFGHANSLRQAKALGDWLVVGVHSDADITTHKGPPLMSEEERYEAVAACKWVDEVYRAAPYTTALSVLDEVRADFCVHGDDLVTNADGVDCYLHVKQAGRFKTVPRTEGISTTALVGRMLQTTADSDEDVQADDVVSPYTGATFLPSSRRYHQFSSSAEPKPGDVVGYVLGAFDLFHVGHIRFLQKARKNCDFLVVGVLGDEDVHAQKVGNWPVMNIHERSLSVLACRYVDTVVFGAPTNVNAAVLAQLNVNKVFKGTQVDRAYKADLPDAYTLPREKGMLVELESPSTLTTSDIIDRIVKHRSAFAERNKKKEAKEIREFGKLLHT